MHNVMSTTSWCLLGCFGCGTEAGSAGRAPGTRCIVRPVTATLPIKSALSVQWHGSEFLRYAQRLSIVCVFRYYRFTMSIMPDQDCACFRLVPLVSRQLNRETDATTFMPVKQSPLQPCHLTRKRCLVIDSSELCQQM